MEFVCRKCGKDVFQPGYAIEARDTYPLPTFRNIAELKGFKCLACGAYYEVDYDGEITREEEM